MPTYLFDDGKNLQPCVINGIKLHNYGIDVNLETELEDDKGVTLTETAGVQTIPQLSGRKTLSTFTLSFKYGVEPTDIFGNDEGQEALFDKQSKIIEELYLLNEPLEILFKDLEKRKITKMFMLHRNIKTFELYEEVYIECVEYSTAYYKIQSSKSAEDWYVNTLDNSDLLTEIEDDFDKIGGGS